jgi:hypothetical protein
VAQTDAQAPPQAAASQLPFIQEAEKIAYKFIVLQCKKKR